MPQLKVRKSKPRMRQLLAGATPDELNGLAGSRFIPAEEIVTAQRNGRFPVRFEFVLHDGSGVKIRWGFESEEMGEGWAALAQVVSRAAEADASCQPVQATTAG